MPVPDFVLELRRAGGSDPALAARQSRRWSAAPRTCCSSAAPTTVSGRRSPASSSRGRIPASQPGARPGRRPGCGSSVDRLAMVSVTPPVIHVNGDRAIYLDHTFACTWLEGEAEVGDDESVEVQWWPRDQLPPMKAELAARIEAACSGEERTQLRFVTRVSCAAAARAGEATGSADGRTPQQHQAVRRDPDQPQHEAEQPDRSRAARCPRGTAWSATRSAGRSRR